MTEPGRSTEKVTEKERCPECNCLRIGRLEYCPKCGRHYEYTRPRKKREPNTAPYKKCKDCRWFVDEGGILSYSKSVGICMSPTKEWKSKLADQYRIEKYRTEKACRFFEQKEKHESDISD